MDSLVIEQRQWGYETKYLEGGIMVNCFVWTILMNNLMALNDF